MPNEPTLGGGVALHGFNSCCNRNDSSTHEIAKQTIFHGNAFAYRYSCGADEQQYERASMPFSGKNMQRWLRDALDASGHSQADLSRHLTEVLGRSVDKTAVNKMLTGVRRIKGDELLEIARFTGARIPGSASGSNIVSLGDAQVLQLDVIGFAETSAYRTTQPTGAQPAKGAPTFTVPFDRRFPNARQYILRQRGDGMAAANPAILDGAYVRVVQAEDAKLEIRDGQIVVIENKIHDGSLVERSLRRIRILDGGIVFRAESQTPYEDLQPADNVRIVGFVTAVVNVLDLM
jgi:hypothetical protein